MFVKVTFKDGSILRMKALWFNYGQNPNFLGGTKGQFVTTYESYKSYADEQLFIRRHLADDKVVDAMTPVSVTLEGIGSDMTPMLVDTLRRDMGVDIGLEDDATVAMVFYGS